MHESQPVPGGKMWLFRGILITLTVLAIEGVFHLATQAGLVTFRVYPVNNEIMPLTFVGNINPFFGIWHVPNASVRVPIPGGTICYETNAEGMRDRPRDRRSSAGERVVTLGDSFLEGCYVSSSNRMTDLMEQKTGIEFLNFGTSGGFGSVQEWQLYQHLARAFDHTQVLLFLLPDNDFTDNNPACHPSNRFQPFLQKSNGTYTVAYNTPFHPEGSQTVHLPWGRSLRHACYNRWKTLNILMNVDFERLFSSRSSAYDDFTDEDLAQLLFSYEQLGAAAGPRPLTIFIIPRDRDFIAVEQNRFKGRISTALSTWASQQKQITVVDLLPGFLAYMKEHKVPYQDFFLAFDPHWSPLGHRVASELVLASLKKQHVL